MISASKIDGMLRGGRRIGVRRAWDGVTREGASICRVQRGRRGTHLTAVYPASFSMLLANDHAIHRRLQGPFAIANHLFLYSSRFVCLLICQSVVGVQSCHNISCFAMPKSCRCLFHIHAYSTTL